MSPTVREAILRYISDHPGCAWVDIKAQLMLGAEDLPLLRRMARDGEVTVSKSRRYSVAK